ncbi:MULTISPECIES: general stress protein CsbD [unclassified Flavobacterium]|uniref:general stress protein CsbD n=1 Tax=unclassified Flavobacterium TaxID=196869 RepID=UPI00131E509E|nr:MULTISPECIES: general stress protein CsbD [unclassified Flavobacterium]
MNSNDLEGNWEEQKEKLKEKFVTLTSNKSLFSKSKKEEMLKKYQDKLGKTREKLIVIFQSL